MKNRRSILLLCLFLTLIFSSTGCLKKEDQLSADDGDTVTLIRQTASGTEEFSLSTDEAINEFTDLVNTVSAIRRSDDDVIVLKEGFESTAEGEIAFADVRLLYSYEEKITGMAFTEGMFVTVMKQQKSDLYLFRMDSDIAKRLQNLESMMMKDSRN